MVHTRKIYGGRDFSFEKIKSSRTFIFTTVNILQYSKLAVSSFPTEWRRINTLQETKNLTAKVMFMVCFHVHRQTY